MAIGFAALAITRRGRGQLVAGAPAPRFELDPVGPAEGIEEALELPHELTPRTEAEALAGLSVAWPLKPPSPAGDAPIHATVPDRGEVAGRDRHEISSLFGDHAIAPDARAAGEELVDPGAVEVPIGHSADNDFDFRLSKDKLVQPDTTGGVLREPAERAGFSQVETVAQMRAANSGDDLDELDIDFDELDDDDEDIVFTAELMEQPTTNPEAYDTVLPEDLGTEWLSRATEAPMTVALDPIDDIAEIPLEPESVMSDDAELTRSPLRDDDVEVPKDLWDAVERTRR